MERPSKGDKDVFSRENIQRAIDKVREHFEDKLRDISDTRRVILQSAVIGTVLDVHKLRGITDRLMELEKEKGREKGILERIVWEMNKYSRETYRLTLLREFQETMKNLKRDPILGNPDLEELRALEAKTRAQLSALLTLEKLLKLYPGEEKKVLTDIGKYAGELGREEIEMLDKVASLVSFELKYPSD